MVFNEVMDRFVKQSAASVMFRGTLENVVTAELLDAIFVKTAKRQRPSELLFSSIVDLLAMVATGSRKSVNDAYKAKKERFSPGAILRRLARCGPASGRETFGGGSGRWTETLKRVNVLGSRK